LADALLRGERGLRETNVAKQVIAEMGKFLCHKTATAAQGEMCDDAGY
jgi:hypothetical protein